MNSHVNISAFEKKNSCIYQSGIDKNVYSTFVSILKPKLHNALNKKTTQRIDEIETFRKKEINEKIHLIEVCDTKNRGGGRRKKKARKYAFAANLLLLCRKMF